MLTALNQGDAIVRGDLSSALLWKVPLTYCVPYLVTTWGALSRPKYLGAGRLAGRLREELRLIDDAERRAVIPERRKADVEDFKAAAPA